MEEIAHKAELECDSVGRGLSGHQEGVGYTESKLANLPSGEVGNMGLLALIDKVKVSLETNHSKKIEELEYKILEKEEILSLIHISEPTRPHD